MANKVKTLILNCHINFGNDREIIVIRKKYQSIAILYC